MRLQWRGIAQVIVLVILYILLGNARSIEANPFIPGAVIAVNMIVPVLAGILFGPKCGLLVGLFGTTLNALSPAGTLFEMLAIIPHGIMGFTGGLLRKRYPTPIAAFALLVGHMLNLILFSIFGLIPQDSLMNLMFWYGITYEIFFGVIAIKIIATIFRLGFPHETVN